MKLDNIQPQRKNANRHTERGMRELEASIQADGMIGAITVAANGEIFDGSARREVIETAGLADAIIVRSDGSKPIIHIREDIATADDPRAIRLGLAANKIAADNLSWDAALLAEIQAQDATLLAGLFSEGELDALLAEITPAIEPGAGGDEFDTTPAEGPTRTQRGDLWQLGDHRLLVDDCTVAENVARLMDGKRAVFEFADPPYELGPVGGGIVGASAHRGAIRAANIDTFSPANLEMIAPTAVFCCNKPLIPAYLALADRLRASWDICFYAKTNTAPNHGGHMMTDVEYLMLLGKQAPISGQDKDLYSKVYVGTLDVDSDVAWQKPIALVEKYIKLFSKQYDVVADRFSGTGTTLIAAQRIGRICYGCEIEPKYADVILRRWETETGQTARKVES